MKDWEALRACLSLFVHQTFVTGDSECFFPIERIASFCQQHLTLPCMCNSALVWRAPTHSPEGLTALLNGPEKLLLELALLCGESCPASLRQNVM